MLRRAGTVAAGGGLVTGLSMVDWPALLALLAVSAMAITATCWIVSDRERPKRLALLIRTWRGQPPRPSAARASRPRPRAVAPARKVARAPDGR
ncbi:hypothetical protein ACFP2T_39575 [Plantactinospora solaniradicis]|uniref:Uncharacterized protein n=1 Tax=Plantactinospora solaniradicis TaxID=1723736 RepID=A0ABW1KKS7_9ACTN